MRPIVAPESANTPRMTASQPPRPSWRDAFAVYLQPRVLIVLLLGFSSGLPLALSGSTLRFWLRESHVDLETIGLFALVGTPYTIKFLWAPLVDALSVPFLSDMLGRRRGWLILSQLLLVAAIILLGCCNPASTPWYFPFGAAVLVATASATQDIVVDAFRIESLPKPEQAAGMASYVAAYRISTLVSTAGALFLIDAFERSRVFKKRRLEVRLCGDGRTGCRRHRYRDLCPGARAIPDCDGAEFRRSAAARIQHHQKRIRRFSHARCGRCRPALRRPVQVHRCLLRHHDRRLCRRHRLFSKTDYAAIVKGVGLAATLIGGFAGGYVARRYSLVASLWIGGVLQAVANLSFSWLALIGVNQWALAFAITVENFTSAIGTVIFVAYLSALCRNPLHTATQYALLTALSAVGRTYLSSGAGYVATATGWPLFFAICVLVAIPSLILLSWLQRRGHFDELGPVKV